MTIQATEFREGTTRETKAQKRYKPYAFVSLKRDKKCVRPVIYAYGTNTKEICEAAVNAYERVRNELIQKGYTVAPLERIRNELIQEGYTAAPLERIRNELIQEGYTAAPLERIQAGYTFAPRERVRNELIQEGYTVAPPEFEFRIREEYCKR